MAEQTSSNSIGKPFIELKTVESTNKYAMGLVHAGMAQHGMAIFAHAQTAGKGQRGKSWETEPEANITLTTILQPGFIGLHEQFYLSAATALAAHQFFSKYAGEDTKIKWPNDLYWRDRKAGGILIESVIGSRKENQISDSVGWQWAVIGIGINMNQTSFSAELPNPVSLKQITGKNFDPVLMAKEFCVCLNEQVERLQTGNRIEMLKQYNQQLYKQNEKVKLKKDNRVFEAIINGVSSTGKLMTTHAIDEEFDFGTVEWLVKP